MLARLAVLAAGTGSVQPIAMPLLADSYRTIGQLDEARTLLAEASKVSTELEQHHYNAELHRLKGELLLSEYEPDLPQAADCFENALEIARRQQAKSLELRASTSLARLWRDQGRGREAIELLAPVYDWFTEGFETPDLKDAKALLDELA